MNPSNRTIRSLSTSILALVMALGGGGTLWATDTYLGYVSFSSGYTSTAITIKSTAFPSTRVSDGKTYALSSVSSASSITFKGVSDSSKSLKVTNCFDTLGGGSVKVSEVYATFGVNYFYISEINVICSYTETPTNTSATGKVLSKTYTWSNANTSLTKTRIVNYAAAGYLAPERLSLVFVNK